jgi:hypothetical protein
MDGWMDGSKSRQSVLSLEPPNLLNYINVPYVLSVSQFLIENANYSNYYS